MAREDPSTGLLERKPRPTIDLGDVDHAARARRPLDGAEIAYQQLRVAVAFRCPGTHDFSARLPDFAQINRASRGREAGLLLKLTHRCGKRLFVLGVFTLWDRPGTQVLFSPRRALPGEPGKPRELLAPRR